eukprot:m.57593 g.57593  ORF g.57593 m.57593 type:complete len:364 (-) comp13737_c0_seq1:27-1118(-)
MAVAKHCYTAFTRRAAALATCNTRRWLTTCQNHRSGLPLTLDDSTFERLNAGGFATTLAERSILKIQGKDTIEYLQGMTTNDLLSLQSDSPPTAIFTMFLNAPGRVLADAIIVPEQVDDTSQSLFIDCHQDVANMLVKHLKRFKLRSKFTLEEVSDRYSVAVGLSSELPLLSNRLDPRFATITPSYPFPLPTVQRAVVAKEDTADISDDNVLYHYWRSRIGLGEGPLDYIPQKALPLESNLEEFNGVAYFKGCYLGQELTARTHFTGTLRKRIVPVQLLGMDSSQASLLAEVGSDRLELRTSDGKRAGTFLSHVRQSFPWTSCCAIFSSGVAVVVSDVCTVSSLCLQSLSPVSSPVSVCFRTS